MALASSADKSSRAVATFADRDEWLRAVTTDKTLSLAVRVVATRMMLYLNLKTGQCNPAYSTLSVETGVHRATVIRAINSLVAAGWLTPTDSDGSVSNNFKPLLKAANGRTGATVEEFPTVALASQQDGIPCVDPGNPPSERCSSPELIRTSIKPPLAARPICASNSCRK